METGAKSHRQVQEQTGRGKAGQREKGRGQGGKAKAGDTGTDTPRACVAQSVARGPSSPDWTEAVKWACKRGLLQALWAPGLKLSPILEGGPPVGLSSLICEVGVTILAPPSLEGVAFPTTEPQAALPVVSHPAQFSCSHSTLRCQE